MQIIFTYHTITPESAEEGGFEDHGFYDIGGWKYSLNDEKTRKDIDKNPTQYEYNGGLAQALIEAKNLGCCESSQSQINLNTSKISFSSVDGDTDYSTGEETYYSVHFDGISSRTLARIVKKLT